MQIGEYWADEDGSLTPADGDASHEAIVLARVRSEVLDYLGIQDNEIDPDVLCDPTAWRNALAIGQHDAESWIATLRSSMPSLPHLAEVIAAAQDKADLREYAVQRYGWTWIRGTAIGVRDFSEDSRRRLKSCLDEVLDLDGVEAGEEPTWEVHVLGKPGVRMVHHDDLLETPTAEVPVGVNAKNGLASHLDRTQSHPCYGGNLGD